MGHMVGKDYYRKLGKKIDGLAVRAPWNDALYEIVKELYTVEEAELIVKMPYGMADLDTIVKVTGFDKARTEKLLTGLAEKGLVMDIYMMGGFRYMISPMVIGIFEFTMMRTQGEINPKHWAKLFHDYIDDDKKTFFQANFGHGEKISPLRTLPWEGTIKNSDYVEVLDYEKASQIVEQGERCAVGICSCRHEQHHLGTKKCDIPLEKCSTFGKAGVDWIVSHGFAREVGKTEMLENLAHSKENGLVLCADNVQNHIGFICHCCSCCCNILRGVRESGFTELVVTSSYIAKVDDEACIECGNCAEACPVNAIAVPESGVAVVDEEICLGCGVCALDCDSDSLKLTPREKRIIPPETSFERVILQCLERGTLQNLLFSDPGKLNHKFLRGVVGGFLKLPPVKKALMSDTLRSSFLEKMRKGA